jgi:large subunit ribosomal protein L7A
MSYDKVKQAGKLIGGAKQALKAVEAGSVREVFIAKDADPRVTSKMVSQCRKLSVPVTYVESMKQLGKACGIDVGAAVVAAVNE